MRALRWVGIAAGALVALLVAAAIVAYATIDTQAIARYAADEVARVTGRTIAARGPIEIAFWPRLAVVANDVTFSNAPGASRPELARARVVKGAVATWPLIRSRQVVAESIELEGLDLALETLPDGRGNWQFAAAGGGAAVPADASPGQPFRLAGKVVLVDAKVAWRPSGGTPLDVVVPRLSVEPQDGGRYAWRGTFDVDATRWTLEGASGDPFMTLRQRVPLDVDARVAGGGVTLTARGRIERRESGAAAVLDTGIAWEAGSERMRRWSPELAREGGRVSTRVDARDKRYVFGTLAGAYGPTKFDGNATVDQGGARPRIGGRLHLDQVDFPRERPPALATAAAVAGEKGSPLAALARFDADFDYVVDRVRVSSAVEATNLRGRVVVAQGRLAIDPFDVDLAGGRVRGQISGDAATTRLRIVAEGSGVEAARLLGRLDPGRNATGGLATFAIDLQGPVPALDRFVDHATGTFRADIGPMRIKGATLDAGGEVLAHVLDALNPFRRVDPSTEVQCVVARLAVRDGVAHADRTLAVETSRLALSASGTIDLRNESLDLLVRPRARRIAGLPAVELAEVVRVTGPIRQPSVRLDTVGAAKTAITIGGAIATGGWSLLATPLLNAGDDPNPCATARAGGRAAARASPEAAAPAGDPLAPLRGLFRR
jgi:hypothetical protein